MFTRECILILMFFASGLILYAQEVNREAEPVDGIGSIRSFYDAIHFTGDQRNELKKHNVEFTFRVDETGKATLIGIRGVYESSVLDSLKKKSEHLPDFRARIQNGVAVSSLYSVSIHFQKEPNPAYSANDPSNNFDPTQVESFHLSGKNIDVVVGLVVPFYSGPVSDYLIDGGGLKLDFLFGTTKINYGLVFDLLSSRKVKDYPINSTRKQSEYPILIFLGGAFNTKLLDKPKSRLIIQAELCYAYEEVSPKLDQYDHDNIGLSGFSPGMTLHYMVRIGRNKFGSEYISKKDNGPVVYYKFIDFSAGIRGLRFNSLEASGLMIEASVSFRLNACFLDSYRLKNN